MGKIATFSMLRGDILRGARLAEHLGGSTLASLIEPTKRAISVRVDDVVGVGGFLLPGNRVDVLATRQTGNTGDAESKTILEDLRVLAVDQTASTDKTQPVVVRAVTLEMTPCRPRNWSRGWRPASCNWPCATRWTTRSNRRWSSRSR